MFEFHSSRLVPNFHLRAGLLTPFMAKQDLTGAEEWPWQLGSALGGPEWRPLRISRKAKRRAEVVARRPGASSDSRALCPWRPHTGLLRSTLKTMVLGSALRASEWVPQIDCRKAKRRLRLARGGLGHRPFIRGICHGAPTPGCYAARLKQ